MEVICKGKVEICNAKLCSTLVTPWAIACQGFSRQEYWSGLPFPSPGDLPDPGLEPRSPALQMDFCIANRFFLPTELQEKPFVMSVVINVPRKIK